MGHPLSEPLTRLVEFGLGLGSGVRRDQEHDPEDGYY